jgi:hypothetical protein
MANFAVIKEDKVINVIVCESKELAEQITGELCVEYTALDNPTIGLGYDGTKFEQPVITEPTE